MNPMTTGRIKKERADKLLQKVAEKISAEDHETLTLFSANCYSEGLSPGRVYKYTSNLTTLLKQTASLGNTKPIRTWQEADIRQYIAWLELQENYSKSTKQDFKVLLKKLFKWLNGGKYPPAVEWLKVGKKEARIKFNGELLTEEEISRMLDREENPQIKAFIGMLYESGMRHGEILNLKIKDVRFDSYGCIISADGKTGPRTIRTVKYAPLLKAWLDSHPQKRNPESSLWINWAGKPMGYNGFTKYLKAAAKRAGIKKRVFYHLYRHSRSTHVSGRLSEALMKQYFGWQMNSGMPAVYIHLKGDETENAILELNGIRPETAKETPKAPVLCPRCDKPNMWNAKTCFCCSYPFGVPEAMEAEQQTSQMDDVLKKLLSNPQTRSVFKELLRQVVREGDTEDPHSGPLAAGGKPKETIKEGV